ncbi:hypothetical protein [Actinomadura rupiterrae]|uniref:hypothetical protein n=1 Tax=Actinomadura rupiterrae TaxID=559627 RepID=UPI0020A2D7D4|nr:hypothetical protein [Actinomadura rupiterrae]MCP2335670.1 hypothetical protein [Actinomadura rupiterrae]
MVASISPIARPRGRRTACAPRPARALRRMRGGHALAAAGLALLPWMALLALRTPSTAHVTNWSAAWIGLDALLAAGLIGTGLLAARRDPRLSLPAAATAALLFMDAWFDVLTSAPGADRAFALVLAAGMELPLAAVCAVLAVRAFPKPAA